MEPAETFFRRLVEGSPDGIWALDLEGRTVYANARTAELLGRTPDEMSGLSVLDVLDEPGQEQFARHLAQLPVTGPVGDEVECSYVHTDGGYVRLAVSEWALTDERGRLVGYVHRLTEDEERRRLLDELSHSRKLLDEAQAIARIGSWQVEAGTGVTFWSRQLFEMMGMDPDGDTASAATFMDRVVEEDAIGFDEWVQRVAAGGGELELDQRLRFEDGTVRWFRSRARADYDAEGAMVRIGGTVQDITDIKDVERQLLDAVVLNALLQVMVTAANNADTVAEALVAVRTHLLGHEDWLRAVSFAVERGEDGRCMLTPFLADRPEFVPDPVEWALADQVLRTGGIAFDEETRPATPSVATAVTVDGEPLCVGVLTASAPFRRRSMVRSLVSQVANQLRRVAEREQHAAELAAARDSAMEASRLKSGFLAMISHEIRTPLNGVLGLNELLAHTGLDPRQQRLVEGIEVAGRSLLGLINDILDFSKIEAGQLALESVAFDLRALVARAVTVVSAGAANKGLAVTVEIPPEVPARLVGDPTRLGQVVTNLLSNAVKFTSEGGITVRMTVAGTGDGFVDLTTEVEDTGIGIDDATVTRLFQPFQQADASTTRTHGGTGLGLAISRQLVQAIGGELEVRTEPGAGSTFWFTARFAVADEPTAASEPAGSPTEAPPRPQPTAGRVLLAEDNEINRMVALGLLESLGYAGDVVTNGAEAVQKAAGGAYDAVLMDLQMPVMDGIAATRAIRSSEPAGRRLPIVALTASAITGEQERCVAAGMDDFLSKPVNRERLASVLSRHVQHPAAPGATAEDPDVTDAEPTEAAPTEAEPTETPVLEPRRLDELLAMGERAKPLVQRAATNFIANLPGTLADLEKAVVDEDSPTLRAVAHRLRGSALNLGATGVAEVTLELELLGDDGRAAGAADLVRLLAEVGDATVAALAAYLADNDIGG